MGKYFSEPTFSGVIVKVELYLSHYSTKADLKHAPSVDTSKVAKKS